jgi:hypothetical protein
MRSFHTQKDFYQAVSFFLVLILLAVFRPGQALAQAANAGTISQVSGTVQIQRGAATIPATQGMPVQVGDRVITGDDGHVVVLLTDQSTLELGDSSNIEITQHSGAATRVNLLAGVVRSFVNKTVGAAAPNFEVHTPNAVAAARGTLFDTAFLSGVSRPTYGDIHTFTDVSVRDGVVNLANVNNLAGGVDIPAGYESTVAGTLNAAAPGPLGMTGAVSFGGPAGTHTGVATGSLLAAVPTVPPPSCPVCPPQPQPPGGGTTPPPSGQ